MPSKVLRSWKKVFENDLAYVVSEMREITEKPALIILTGEVGAGKTSFCKQFVQDGELQSPTYSIISETPTVMHADFYRIKSHEEVIHLELSLYNEGKEYFLIEWGKKFISILDKEVDEKIKFYELIIEENKTTDRASRNYTLQTLDRV